MKELNRAYRNDLNTSQATAKTTTIKNHPWRKLLNYKFQLTKHTMNPQKLKHKCFYECSILFNYISLCFCWTSQISKEQGKKIRHNYMAHRVDLGNWYWWRQTIDCQMSTITTAYYSVKQNRFYVFSFV